MTRFAKFISYIFHPIVFFLIMPYVIVYKITANHFYAIKWEVFSSAFIFMGIILILFGRLRGAFSDEDVSVRNERNRLFFILYILSLSYFVIALFFKGIFFPLSIIAFSIVLGILLFNIVNKFIKVSIHCAIASAFVTAIAILLGIEGFLATIFIIPLTIWSRIVLRKHTVNEAVIGGFLGILITFLTFLTGKYFY
ncbi:phosphatase PAP2 family protein [Candidatus Parcubacteria bacterium]|nr:MAG: phosphatase PAP2 family protein [Candidatus Parcubacteria bacterium]